MSPTPDSSEDRIAAAVARALELKDEGAHDWLERAVEGSPELEAEVKRAVAGSGQVADVLFTARDEDPLLGRTLANRFRLARRAGAGAMGAVYEAEDVELGRTVAVKVVRSGFVAAETARKRFAREAEAMAAVRNGAVVTIHDRGETPEGDPFLVMEWIDGRTLDDTIEKAAEKQRSGARDSTGWLEDEFGIEASGESSWIRLVARWVYELGVGLDEVHRAGVLHRDIKPTNVMVRKDGSAALLDFGLALLDDASKLTRAPSSIGTPAYMPPESLNSDDKHTVAGDVYSLGATLYHALTLVPPYRGTPAEIIAQVSTREPVPAVRRRPGLPRDLQAILDKALQRKPSARYTDAAAFAADLGAYLAHEPVSVRPIPGWQRVVRRAGRSWFVRGMAAAVLMIAMLASGSTLAEQRAEQRAEESFEIVRHLPPNVTTVMSNNRRYRFEADRDAVRAQLDRLVALGVEPVRALLLRSSFRLDHGDPAGSATDFVRLAAELDTPYTRSLAQRYGQLPADAGSHSDLDLSELPTPETVHGHFLAGYHLLRSGDYSGAYAEFCRPGVRDLPMATELRLALTPFPELVVERWPVALAALDELMAYESSLPAPTATTRHIASRLLTVLGRYPQSLAAAEASVALAGRTHTNRINAAYPAMALGRFGQAHAHLDVARELQPRYFRPVLLRIWTLTFEQRYDEALEAFDEVDLDLENAEGWKLVRRSYVETARALDLHASGRLAEADAASVRAVRDIFAAQDLGPISYSDPEFIILEGIAESNYAQVFEGLALRARDDPFHRWHLGAWLQAFPEDLSEAETAAVKQYLMSLADALAIRTEVAPTPAANVPPH